MRDEPFGKADDARAVRARLADEPAGLLGRAFAVEEHGRSLDGRDLHHAVDITHKLRRHPEVAAKAALEGWPQAPSSFEARRKRGSHLRMTARLSYSAACVCGAAGFFAQ